MPRYFNCSLENAAAVNGKLKVKTLRSRTRPFDCLRFDELPDLVAAIHLNLNITCLSLDFYSGTVHWESRKKLKNAETIAIGQAIGKLTHLASIKIDLQENPIGAAGALAICTGISQLRELSSLKLELGATSLRDEGAIAVADAVGQLKKLKSLNLSFWYNGIGVSGARALGDAIGQLTALTSLTLCFASNHIGAEGTTAVCDAIRQLSKLESLNLVLRVNSIGTEGASAVSGAIRQLSNLTSLTLGLERNQFGTEGTRAVCEAIANLINLTSLDLDLGVNSIGEAGASAVTEYISQLSHLTSLALKLSGNDLSIERKNEHSALRRTVNARSKTTIPVLLPSPPAPHGYVTAPDEPLNHIETPSPPRQPSLGDSPVLLAGRFAVFADNNSILQLAETLSRSFDVPSSPATTDRLSTQIRELEDCLAHVHSSLKSAELTKDRLECLLARRAAALSQLEDLLSELLANLETPVEQIPTNDQPALRLGALLERSIAGSATDLDPSRPAAAPQETMRTTAPALAASTRATPDSTTNSFEAAYTNLLGTLGALYGTVCGDLSQMRAALQSDPRFCVGRSPTEQTAAINAVRIKLSQARSTCAGATKVSELRIHYAERHRAIDELEDVKHKREVEILSLENTRSRLERRGGTLSSEQTKELASLRAGMALDRRRLCRNDHMLRSLEDQLLLLSPEFPEALRDCFYPGLIHAPSPASPLNGSFLVDRERSWEADYTEKVEIKSSTTGHAGTVWRAIYLTVDEYDDEVRQECIVKRYIFNSSTGRERFFAELNTLSSLRHPNILAPECVFTNDPATYLHMQFVPRGDMEQWISKENPSSARLRRIFSQVASTLIYLHQKGIVHRDLKLQNVLVGDRDHPLLIDFDTARNLIELPTSNATTVLVATPLYCAPERSARRYPVDVWSFGMMLLMAFFPAAAPMITVAINDYMSSPCDYLLNPTNRGALTLWPLAHSARGQHSLTTANSVLTFASSLLRRDPAKRPAAHQLLLSPFFTELDESTATTCPRDVGSSDDERTFRVWRRALNKVVANRERVKVKTNRAHLVHKVLGFLEPVLAVPEMRNVAWRVRFSGEAGIDAGGLRTELYTQFFEALRGQCVFVEPEVPSWMLCAKSPSNEANVALPRGDLDGSKAASLVDCTKVGACMARAAFSGVQIPRWLPFAFYLFVKVVGPRDELFAEFDPSNDCTAPLAEQFSGVLDELDALTTGAHHSQMNEAEAAVCMNLAMPGMAQHIDKTFAGLAYAAGAVTVTDANRFAYIRLRRRHTLYADRLPQLWAMVGGIRLLFKQFKLWDVFLGMTPSQMECVFSGPNLVDVHRLLQVLDLSELPERSPLHSLVPEALRGATQSELESFLVKMFAQPRLPLSCKSLKIRRSPIGAIYTHTCPVVWSLELPEMADLDILRAVLFERDDAGLTFNTV